MGWLVTTRNGDEESLRGQQERARRTCFCTMRWSVQGMEESGRKDFCRQAGMRLIGALKRLERAGDHRLSDFFKFIFVSVVKRHFEYYNYSRICGILSILEFIVTHRSESYSE